MKRLACIAGFDLSAHDSIDIRETLDSSSTLDKFNVMCWLRTVCNGWNTSYRLHSDDLLGCVFGCKVGKDELRHYLSCPIFLSLVSVQFGPLGPSPMHRLNLAAPSPQKAIIVTSMFNMYHTLKVGHRSVVDAAFIHGRFGHCCQIATNVAKEIFSQYSKFFVQRLGRPLPSDRSDAGG